MNTEDQSPAPTFNQPQPESAMTPLPRSHCINLDTMKLGCDEAPPVPPQSYPVAAATTHYVAGFMFDRTLMRVALIRKLKPAWQKGKLNGIGGKVENETTHEAMAREFKEETGGDTKADQWERYLQISGSNEDGTPFHVDFFATLGNLSALRSIEEEQVELIYLKDIHPTRDDMIENLPWLIPLAIDCLLDGRPSFVDAHYGAPPSPSPAPAGPTPETDEAFRLNPLNDFNGKPVVSIEVARNLERQRDAAAARVTELEEDGKDLDFIEERFATVGRAGYRGREGWGVTIADPRGHYQEGRVKTIGFGITARSAIRDARAEQPGGAAQPNKNHDSIPAS